MGVQAEENIRICKICRVMKKRILAGKFDSINKKWVDENNGLWNGSVCPDCHRLRSKSIQAKKRKDKPNGP